jgi:hypothetical protein
VDEGNSPAGMWQVCGGTWVHNLQAICTAVRRRQQAAEAYSSAWRLGRNETERESNTSSYMWVQSPVQMVHEMYSHDRGISLLGWCMNAGRSRWLCSAGLQCRFALRGCTRLTHVCVPQVVPCAGVLRGHCQHCLVVSSSLVPPAQQHKDGPAAQQWSI